LFSPNHHSHRKKNCFPENNFVEKNCFPENKDRNFFWGGNGLGIERDSVKFQELPIISFKHENNAVPLDMNICTRFYTTGNSSHKICLSDEDSEEEWDDSDEDSEDEDIH
jgi:hypothetical protein